MTHWSPKRSTRLYSFTQENISISPWDAVDEFNVAPAHTQYFKRESMMYEAAACFNINLFIIDDWLIINNEEYNRISSIACYLLYISSQSWCWCQAALVATAGEFEGYKVRVHNVLKQQKSKTTAQSEGESGKLER